MMATTAMDMIFFRTTLLSLAATAILAAQGSQNSDFSLLAGLTPSATQVTLGPKISTSAAAAFESAFGHQLRRTKAGDLWFDLTFDYIFRSDATVNGGAAHVVNGITIVAPGLRYQLPGLPPRLGLFGVAGFGIGGFGYNAAVAGAGQYAVRTGFSVHGVGELGAGLDIRLPRLLSLRAEVRDFITSRGQGGVDGRSRIVVLGGIAFHN
jgi:hypothetical protein